MNEAAYAEALELVGYNALSLRAMCLRAYQERKNKSWMKAASSAWGRNARHYAKAVEYFDDIEYRNLGVDALLSRIYAARLSKQSFAVACVDSHSTEGYWKVREAVDAFTQRKPRKEQGASLAERCARLVYAWRSEGHNADIRLCGDSLADEPEVAAVLAKQKKAK